MHIHKDCRHEKLYLTRYTIGGEYGCLVNGNVITGSVTVAVRAENTYVYGRMSINIENFWRMHLGGSSKNYYYGGWQSSYSVHDATETLNAQVLNPTPFTL